MAVPSGIVLRCEECGEVPHRVLRGRVSGRAEIVFEGVVKCSRCGRVRSVVTREPRPLELPLIVSWLGRSSRTAIEMGPEERVRVGDEVDLPEGRVRITAIESGDRRVREAAASSVRALWAAKIGKVRVLVSVNLGNRTASREVIAEPDEKFLVGDVVELGATKVLVHRIRTRHRTLRAGSAAAADIVRVYGRAIRERESR